MAARKTLQLDEENRAQLQRIAKRSSDWRERERAQTLLLLDSGLFAQDVADQLGLNVRAVRTTHIRWRQSAFHRCNRPGCDSYKSYLILGL